VFPHKRASRFIIRCTTPAIYFVCLSKKASAEGFDTFSFRVVPFASAVPPRAHWSNSSCDHIGSPCSVRKGKCRRAELARSRNSFTVFGRVEGWSKSRRSWRAFNSALRCSKRRDISLMSGQHFA
jgi:hypothetical protein